MSGFEVLFPALAGLLGGAGAAGAGAGAAGAGTGAAAGLTGAQLGALGVGAGAPAMGGVGSSLAGAAGSAGAGAGAGSGMTGLQQAWRAGQETNQIRDMFGGRRSGEGESSMMPHRSMPMPSGSSSTLPSSALSRYGTGRGDDRARLIQELMQRGR